jgi:RND family efflux transporter MFP subunit
MIASALLLALALSPQGGKAVTVVSPEPRDLAREIARPVTAAPYARATILARVPGYVAEVAVEEGDTVARGALLARLEVPDLDAELERTRAAVLEAEASLGVARAAVEERRAEEVLSLAEARWWESEAKRLAALHGEGAATEQQREETAMRAETAKAAARVAQAKHASSEAAVAAAEARLATARAEVARLEAFVGFAEVRAPYEKTLVTRRLVHPGALAEAGRTALVEVADVERIRLRTDVPEPDAPFVASGTPVRIRGRTLGTGEIEATVTRTAGALDPETRNLRIEIEVDNASRRILPGAYLEARLVLERREGALTIPAAALLTSEGKARVFVVEDGRVALREVKTGYDDARVVEIVEGLRPDDLVVVGGKERLSEGDAVEASAVRERG